MRMAQNSKDVGLRISRNLLERSKARASFALAQAVSNPPISELWPGAGRLCLCKYGGRQSIEHATYLIPQVALCELGAGGGKPDGCKAWLLDG
jgi:hypothetical protein